MKEIDNFNNVCGGNQAGGNSNGDKSSSGNSPSNSDSKGWACFNDIKNGAAAGAITTGVGMAYVGGPGGATVGIAVGALGGAAAAGATSDKCRVICTHFMRKGLMDQALWRADIAFTRQHLPAAMVRGYHLWAIPYVRLMRRSPWTEKLMLPLALWRAEEIAFRMGLREKGNWKGKLLRWTGEPVCWLIGKVTPEQDWESLWRENSAAV